ncbi:Zinc finger FYVE/PHD-type [Arabidopsis thaliana x Arabidopsis arenosa]|uniref:Zinc finger FYVE/PHD-type n=1 Tax=Arabidopsis thaliana x Arabidopsis arenosa TaxID=1240361 RepID=A0A8T1XDX8_9BRAS|nr:Zinc finger FYVE/PHD-type [Arabidopsis thaliana x Arabidopsis arenosa]
MKDSGSEMINRDWVMKQKRRKLPSILDLLDQKVDSSVAFDSSEYTSSAKPTKHRLKTDLTPERNSSKRKGNDGNYFECVICDLGGDLLCCDSCPRTYHTACLNPPLKRIPNGKWICPKCSPNSEALKPVNRLDAVAKRARTKTTKRNSQAGPKCERASQIYCSSIISGEQSSEKGKSISAEESKSIGKEVYSSPMDGCSTAELGHASADDRPDSSSHGEDDLGKPVIPTADPPSDARLTLPSCEDLSESKLSDTEKNHEAPVEKLEHASSEIVENKTIAEVETGKGKRKKRKRELNDGESLERCKTDKKRVKKSLSKVGSQSTKSPESSKKKKKKNRVTLKSLSKPQSKTETSEKVKKLSKEERRALRATNKSSSYLDEKSSLPAVNLQVDRVLGCRIQGLTKTSLCSALSDDLCSDNLQANDQRDSSVQDTNAELVVAEDRTESSYETGKSSKGSRLKDKDMDESALGTEGMVEVKEEMLSEDNSDATLSRHVDDEDMKVSETPVSVERELLEEAHQETGEQCTVAGEEVEEPVAAKTSDLIGETVSYEFLVKWVGKSNIHNTWISEAELKGLAKRKLENYKSKYGTAVINICEDKWKQPQRIVAIRVSKEGNQEAYVKWTGLAYDECTWESLEEPILKNSSHLIDLFHQYEQKTLERSSKGNPTRERGEGQQSEIVTLTEQPRELRGGALFPHQLEALNWLRRCWHKSKNVILADEMGLGKTVSASAFLSSLYFEFGVARPCLVLVPLSTMPNWLSEFSLWAPLLNVVEYHGSAKGRAIIRDYEWHAKNPTGTTKKPTSYKFNVLLTTYEMVLADSSHLRGVPWEVLVVDEGHRLKNSESKLFSLLNTFSFQHRVLLTGTPLQNNIGEMYNLLNFLQPSSFPSLSSFEERFHDLTSAEKVEELKKLVAPHMLRRLKKDAMQNIPPKTERMVPVELTSIQAEYYRAMLTKNYQILRNIGKGVAQQSMLNIVMQLRKVCNHPYLIPGTEPESGSLEFLHDMRIKASAKLTLLHSMLKVLQKEGHRVLIFSQMTKLLDILEDYLNIEFGPKTFERVDGSVAVADRQAAIARFNQDKNRFVFLLSTRACGLGINLATADTVIIYDSDFNPHADIQAMNRAHRIGQSKRLLVYRLVVRASVEERILQLAKKKLMLDQLFVNKSGSQKEFEDILRWGTEELFNDSAGENKKDTAESNGNLDVIMDLESKSRKKGGGLGDVYQDKCTEGNGKIVWDEIAIMKLLDRSNIQSASTDAADTELENDMLGTVKPVEWNEETADEHVGAESPALVTDDTDEQSSERKDDDVVNSIEENEWDRLLRMRWEKYQSEEEAALGRGKRLRKAVSYREAYAPHTSGPVTESGGEDEKEPEPELKKEYTPAGRALKEKYAKLRERQKILIAKRNSVEDSLPNCNVDQVANQDEESPTSMDLDDSKASHQCDAQRKASSLRLESSSDPKPDLPSHHHGTECLPSLPPNNLPVLGLCAPNFTQSESSRRNYSRPGSRQNRTITGPHFPFNLPQTSNLVEREANDQEPSMGKLNSQNVKEEPFQQPLSNLDGWLPHRQLPPSGDFERPRSSGAAFADFQEKFPLLNLPFDDKLLPRFPFQPRTMGTSHQDIMANLSMRKRFEGIGHSMQDLFGVPSMPFLPNMKVPPMDPPVFSQQDKDLPPLGLDQFPSALSSIPENHRKVLENIMLRTGSGIGHSQKKKTRVDAWSEDELDSLWIGIRRHGYGNWETILRDPRLKFSKFKTPEYLAARWEEEQRKFLDSLSSLPSKPSRTDKSTKSSLFPGLPQGIMNRALHGTKYATPPRFQSHLTDIKLGFSDLASPLPLYEPSDHLGFRSEPFPPMANLCTDNLPGDPSAGPSERPGASTNIPNEKPFPLNSLGMGNLGSLGLDSLSSLNTLRADEKRDAIKRGKLPLFLDMPLPPMLDSSNNVFLGRSANPSFLNPNRGLNLSNPMGRDILGISSSENKLPHWLRDVVTVPTVKSPEPPTLPPTVSAIAQSVRVLYGEDSTTIPPFVIPDPPPPAPRDPRHSLRKKKKRKLHSSSQKTTDIGSSSHNAFESSSQGHPLTSSTPHLPPSSLAGETSGSSEPNLPPHNLNSTEPLSSEAIRFRAPEEDSVIAAAPSEAPGPSLEGITGTTKSISLYSKSSEPKSTNQDGDLDPESDEKIESDRVPLHSDKPVEEKQEGQEAENALNKQCEPIEAESQNNNAEEEAEAQQEEESMKMVSDNSPGDD